MKKHAHCGHPVDNYVSRCWNPSSEALPALDFILKKKASGVAGRRRGDVVERKWGAVQGAANWGLTGNGWAWDLRV